MEKLKRVLRPLVTAGVAMILMASNGCSSNTTGMQIRGNTQGEQSIVAGQLGGDLEVKQIRGEFINGLYRGRVVIANLKNVTQDLQYQFAWYDDAGAELEVDGNGWTPFIIYGKDEKTLVGLAPTPQAKGFRIKVRDLKANKTFKTNFLGII